MDCDISFCLAALEVFCSGEDFTGPDPAFKAYALHRASDHHDAALFRALFVPTCSSERV